MASDAIKLNWRRTEAHALLPDPEPRPIAYTIISVDDHLVEPPGMFDGRLAASFADRAPRVVETEEGHEVWQFDGRVFFQVGLNAVVGRPREDWLVEPTRFEDMRPGCYDIDARIRDMDINGVWASVNFPSQITGFCGAVFSRCSDPELGLAVTRAWNDWFYDEWYSRYPERIVPMGITFLGDAELAAAEIRRNAARGFTGVTLPEQPHRIGMEPIFSKWWDPIIAACAETDTVVCLHVGSTGVADMPAGAPYVPLGATLFGQLSLAACAEWLWSGYPVKHPDLKIAMSEGGIGWVAMLHDRLENIVDRSGYGQYFQSKELRPAEVLHRNFWFCTIDDPSTLSTRHTVGIDHIMFETDYPHGDGTWPDSQAVFDRFYGSLPADEIAKISHANAAALFRHPLPPPDSPHAAGLR
ncbi:MAG TPA: amidohydrolase family protein [Acidimicrobiia bacterium]|nr:amidohydrolase family protein [Acidimicrobiia bacterium]